MDESIVGSIVGEICSSPIFQEFVVYLKENGVAQVFDFHAHVSSGRSDFIDGASEAELDELPQFPLRISDIGRFYDALFGTEGIRTKMVVFDTPLPAYDLTKKNRALLDELEVMGQGGTTRFIPFAVITPAMKRGEIEEYVERGAGGFKISPRTTPLYYQSKRRGSRVTLDDMLTPDALEVANQARLPLLVHLPQPVSSPRMGREVKKGLEEVVSRYPNLKVVLAHLGMCQTPSKIEGLLEWLEGKGLEERIYLDVSAVTIPSVLGIALSSRARLLFGSDLDFSLVERGRYVMIEEVGGKAVIADEEGRGDAKAVLVGASFGLRYKALVSQQGIRTDLPIILFQLEAIRRGADRLAKRKRQQRLRALFFKSAQALLPMHRP